jgi:hypothetical protein
MEEWKKQLQSEALKDKEITAFNLVFRQIIAAYESQKAKRFMILGDETESRRRPRQDDHLYVLDSVAHRASPNDSIFYFRHVSDSWKRLSLKAFEVYERIAAQTLIPMDESVRDETEGLLFEFASTNGALHNRKKILDLLGARLRREGVPPAPKQEDLR